VGAAGVPPAADRVDGGGAQFLGKNEVGEMPDGRAPIVDMVGVSLTYRLDGGECLTAVRDIDLAVPPGRFVSVVGPSGCGKSTILNMIGGLLTPSVGEVRVRGQRLNGLNADAGYIFQQDTLLPWKTVVDNVALGLQLRGIAPAERRRRATAWLHRLGLSGFERSYPHQLSGGMRKRTAVAQTWIMEPDILLMDEPFSALDVQTRQIMQVELLQLWSGSGKTVIFVTHDLEEAVTLSDEVVLLSAGPESRFVGRYPIGLPRPRNLMAIRSQPAFSDVYDQIWNDLRAEVVKSYRHSAPPRSTRTTTEHE
jgi:NitT/TauT family transport system ATP-binding protein